MKDLTQKQKRILSNIAHNRALKLFNEELYIAYALRDMGLLWSVSDAHGADFFGPTLAGLKSIQFYTRDGAAG